MKMRKILNSLFICLLVICLFMIAGCAAYDSETGYKGDYWAPTGEAGRLDGEEGSSENQNPLQPGQVTASAYLDTQNFDYWHDLCFGQATTQNSSVGSFSSYVNNNYFVTTKMVLVKLTDVSNEAIYNADVYLEIFDEVCYRAKTDMTGQAVLYYNTPEEISMILNVLVGISYYDSNSQEVTQTKTFQDALFTTIVFDNLPTSQEKLSRIELMFVIDTTGSMGDELEYLKTEIADVITRIGQMNPNTDILLALLFYRDVSDAYVTRYFDFTTDIATQTQNIKAETAKGGGDFEEAVDVALEKAAAAQWSTGNSTKIIFHVADAPSHSADYGRWNDAVMKAAEKGIKIVTIASSGIDKLTEYLFRSQSMMTNAHYVYLTNDSGIGNTHLDPTIGEEVVVEYLNELIIRLINGYYTGDLADPIDYRQS